MAWAYPQPLDVLRTGVASLAPYVDDAGELRDPVFGVPTQYGTAYYAYCRAVLAAQTAADDPARAVHLRSALQAVDAALRHVEQPEGPPTASGFHRATGTTTATSHRDFFWPPILRTYRLARALGAPEAVSLASRIAAVDPEASFRSRPPSNWAAVWLLGEWLRHRAGLPSSPPARLDGWLAAFFDGSILLEQGLYQEPGHPNSYDLFTRLHLAALLDEGYAGRWQPELERLLRTGLERSLAVQLSDGGLAAAHRSSGQAWNDGAQCAYFTLAARLLRERDPARAAAAEAAAWRALASLARWQRPGGPFSPVYNLLPPDWRVGYEGYTADAHYSALALAFLAVAVEAGLGRTPPPGGEPSGPSVRVEGDPTHRSVVRHGPLAVHVNARPAPAYDGFGLTEVTFGLGRYFHFGPSVRHLAEPGWYNLGLATRTGPGRSALRVLAQEPLYPVGEVAAGHAGLRLRARATGDPRLYELAVEVDGTEVRVQERLHGHPGHVTLLVPYLRDAGTGQRTQVELHLAADTVVRFRHGAERVRLTLAGPCAHVLHLTYGYEGRRGLYGLVRLDLAEPGDGVRYTLALEA